MKPCTDLSKCGDKLISSTCIIWGGTTLPCITFPCSPCGNSLTVTDVVEYLSTAISEQKITYNTDHFTVTGTVADCDQELSLNSGSWTSASPVSLGSNIAFLSSGSSDTLSYLLNALGDVRISATIRTYNGSAYVGSGVGYTNVLQLPSAIAPAQDTVGNHFVCNAYIAASGSTPVAPTLGSETATIGSVVMSKSIKLNGRVLSTGWVQIEFPFNASYHIYLQSVSYSLNT